MMVQDMIKSPLLDIIVPVYNGASYIQAFFDMFKPQADAEVRFLFVDDGSKDNTLSLLKEQEEEGILPMKVIHQENAGVAAARNAGIDASDAAYIAIFDIDDVCAPDYIPTLKENAENGDFDVLIFNRVTFYDDQHKFPEGYGRLAAEISNEEILRQVLFDASRYGISVNILLLSKDYILERNLRFAEGYPYYEDGHFLYRALAGSRRIRRLDRWLYGYVFVHDGSEMNKFSPERLRCLELFKEVEEVLAVEAPGFASVFKKYGISRIYWSILWQTAFVSPSRKDFVRFATATHAEKYMRMLKGFPEGKVRVLRVLYLISKNLYFYTVCIMGRRYTALNKTSSDILDEAIRACPDL